MVAVWLLRDQPFTALELEDDEGLQAARWWRVTREGEPAGAQERPDRSGKLRNFPRGL